MTNKNYNPISKELFIKLNTISPTPSNYYPCKVTLKNGQAIDYVYLVALKTYIKTWGSYPDEKSGKRYISINDVIDIEESPSRLPFPIVNKIYKAGETGMGYTIATFIFKDGLKEVLMNAHDFIDYPVGKNKDDIVNVLPHKGQKAPNLKNGPSFYYCVFSEGTTGKEENERYGVKPQL